MGVPNALIKIVNKNNEIEDFDLSRMVESINAAILDVDGKNLGITEHRALKYAKKIAESIYREYYDMEWLKTHFAVQFISYEPKERIERMKEAFLTERISYVFMEECKDRIGSKPLAKCKDELDSFIKEQIESLAIDPKYTEGLFPDLNPEILKEMEGFLKQQILELSQTELSPKMICPPREYIQDTIETELKNMGEIEVAEGYMIYREGRRKIHSGELSPLQFTRDGIHRDVVRSTLQWNIDHECDSVFLLNEWVQGKNGKDIRELIELSERRYHQSIQNTAQKILKNKDNIQVVIIAGPSCSNKTTTTVIIGQELKKVGLRFKQLNVDDYFFDLSQQPKDRFGDYDFEMPEAIDMDLLNQNLEDLLEGKEIQKPIYNFKKGGRDGTQPFHLEEGEIVLIDCLHGLYRRLTASIPQKKKFRIYIESMNVIRNTAGSWTRWADARMLKRMIRDVQHRGYPVEQTVAHWPYVRKGELKHIIPYIFSTDAVINSGLPYELAALKNILKPYLPENLNFIDSLREQGRLDPYVRGLRVFSLLSSVVELENLDLIPSTSPSREFIGGSSYVIPHNE